MHTFNGGQPPAYSGRHSRSDESKEGFIALDEGRTLANARILPSDMTNCPIAVSRLPVFGGEVSTRLASFPGRAFSSLIMDQAHG